MIFSKEAIVKLISMDALKTPVLNFRELDASTTRQRKSPTTAMNTVVSSALADFISTKDSALAKVEGPSLAVNVYVSIPKHCSG